MANTAEVFHDNGNPLHRYSRQETKKGSQDDLLCPHSHNHSQPDCGSTQSSLDSSSLPAQGPVYELDKSHGCIVPFSESAFQNCADIHRGDPCNGARGRRTVCPRSADLEAWKTPGDDLPNWAFFANVISGSANPSQLLCLGQGGAYLFVLEQGICHITQHRLAMRGGTVEAAPGYFMSHFSRFIV